MQIIENEIGGLWPLQSGRKMFKWCSGQGHGDLRELAQCEMYMITAHSVLWGKMLMATLAGAQPGHWMSGSSTYMFFGNRELARKI